MEGHGGSINFYMFDSEDNYLEHFPIPAAGASANRTEYRNISRQGAKALRVLGKRHTLINDSHL
jgi:hypothetical protein